jgi:two-component system LytT family sensor kinase
LTKAVGERGDFLVLVSNESVRIRMRREQERLAAQATEAELRALRAQINPHFLFNTLNTIAHLIETEPEEAVGTVEKLAGMFRYALLSTKHPTVALSEEMLHVRTLLEIEKIRHGNRLEVNLNLGRGTEERPIPPMVLQPLVENGIKHGADPEGNIRLTISSALVDKKLIIEVADRGAAGIDIDRLLNNSRTGLKNVNQRLLTLYRSSLEFEQHEPRGLLVRIKIPLEREAV